MCDIYAHDDHDDHDEERDARVDEQCVRRFVCVAALYEAFGDIGTPLFTKAAMVKAFCSARAIPQPKTFTTEAHSPLY